VYVIYSVCLSVCLSLSLSLSLFELRYYFDDDVLLVQNAFCQKALVYAAHMPIKKISNVMVNLLSIEKKKNEILI